MLKKFYIQTKIYFDFKIIKLYGPLHVKTNDYPRPQNTGCWDLQNAIVQTAQGFRGSQLRQGRDKEAVEEDDKTSKLFAFRIA